MHSFIIKIWLEETVEETGRTLWRGRITHVPSGHKALFQNIDDISKFITPYLESMGVENDVPRQLRQRLKWLTLLSRLTK